MKSWKMTHRMNCISPGIQCNDFSLFERQQVHRDLLGEIFFFRVKMDENCPIFIWICLFESENCQQMAFLSQKGNYSNENGHFRHENVKLIFQRSKNNRFLTQFEIRRHSYERFSFINGQISFKMANYDLKNKKWPNSMYKWPILK